MNAALIPIVAA